MLRKLLLLSIMLPLFLSCRRGAVSAALDAGREGGSVGGVVSARPRPIFRGSQPGHLKREDNFVDTPTVTVTVSDNATTGQADVSMTTIGVPVPTSTADKQFLESEKGPASPSTIPNLVLWVRADEGLHLSGSNLTQWDDQSGNGNNLVPDTGTTQATHSTGGGTGGQDAIVFAGGGAYTTTNNITDDAFSIFVVYKLSGTAGIIIEQSADANTFHGEYLYGDSPPTLDINRSTGAGSANYASNWSVDNVGHVANFTYAVAGAFTLYRDGTSVATNPTGFAAAPVTDHFYIGGRKAQVLPVTGQIQDVLIYNRSLTTAERNAVGGYVQSRYGITVSGATFDFFWTPVTIGEDVVADTTYGNLEVVGLEKKALPALPGSDQFLHYTGSAWAFSSVTSGVSSVTATSPITASPTTGAVVVGLTTPLTLPNGGLGIASCASGDLVVGNTGTAVSCTGTLPFTLPPTTGGSGQNNLTAHDLIVGNGGSPVNFLAPGTSGNVATSNGTDWTSAASVPITAGSTGSFTLNDTSIHAVANTGLTAPLSGFIVGQCNCAFENGIGAFNTITFGTNIDANTSFSNTNLTTIAGSLNAWATGSVGQRFTVSSGLHTVYCLAEDGTNLANTLAQCDVEIHFSFN